MDLALICGANIGVYEWLTPTRRLLLWLYERLDDMFFSDQWFDHYDTYRYQYYDEALDKIHEDITVIGNYLKEKVWHGLEKDKFQMSPNTRTHLDIEYFTFDMSLFDRWYPLMLFIYELDKANGVVAEGMQLPFMTTITKLDDIVVDSSNYPFRYPIRKI